MLDPKRIELMDPAMVEVYHSKTPAQRLAIAHGMWRYARNRLDGAVRWQHPDWNDEAVRKEVSRRLLRGSG